MKWTNLDPNVVPEVTAPPEGGEENEPSAPESPQLGPITPARGKYKLHCLTIIGQIEGHYILPSQNKTTKYETVIPQLVAIEEEPDIEGLLIILNTVGGDVEAGLALAELISGMHKPTVSRVGRRALHRCAVGRISQAFFHCTLGHHDGASGAHERSGARRAPDLVLFCTYAGAHHPVRYHSFDHRRRTV